MIQIKEIHLKNFICFDEVKLKLDNLCTIIVGKTQGSEKSAIINAIKFIIGPDYNDPVVAQSLMKNQNSNQAERTSDGVRIKLLLKTSNNEGEGILKELKIWRTFRNIKLIFYKWSELDETNEHEIERFQKMFKTNSEIHYPFIDINNLNFDQLNDQSNILNFWKIPSNVEESFRNNCTSYHELSRERQITLNPSVIKALRQQAFLAKVERLNYFKTFFKLTQLINVIFQKLTSNTYNTVFCIERNENLFDLTDSNLNEETYDKIITYIQCGASHKILWTSIEQNIKFLLQIAVKIAFAKYFDKNFILLENVNTLQEHETMQVAKSITIRRNFDENSEEMQQIKSESYLQNIIAVCNELEISAFFEYSAPSVVIENASIICCKEQRKCYVIENPTIADLTSDN